MIDFLQWPALVLSIIGAWCVGGTTSRLRLLGFILFLVSNGLWLLWALGISGWALVVTQLFFTWTSVRGIRSNLNAS